MRCVLSPTVQNPPKLQNGVRDSRVRQGRPLRCSSQRAMLVRAHKKSKPLVFNTGGAGPSTLSTRQSHDNVKVSVHMTPFQTYSTSNEYKNTAALYYVKTPVHARSRTVLEGGSRDAKIVLVAALQPFEDEAAVRLRLYEERVVFDVLNQPVDVPGDQSSGIVGRARKHWGGVRSSRRGGNKTNCPTKTYDTRKNFRQTYSCRNVPQQQIHKWKQLPTYPFTHPFNFLRVSTMLPLTPRRNSGIVHLHAKPQQQTHPHRQT